MRTDERLVTYTIQGGEYVDFKLDHGDADCPVRIMVQNINDDLSKFSSVVSTDTTADFTSPVEVSHLKYGNCWHSLRTRLNHLRVTLTCTDIAGEDEVTYRVVCIY